MSLSRSHTQVKVGLPHTYRASVFVALDQFSFTTCACHACVTLNRLPHIRKNTRCKWQTELQIKPLVYWMYCCVCVCEHVPQIFFPAAGLECVRGVHQSSTQVQSVHCERCAFLFCGGRCGLAALSDHGCLRILIHGVFPALGLWSGWSHCESLKCMNTNMCVSAMFLNPRPTRCGAALRSQSPGLESRAQPLWH